MTMHEELRRNKQSAEKKTVVDARLNNASNNSDSVRQGWIATVRYIISVGSPVEESHRVDVGSRSEAELRTALLAIVRIYDPTASEDDVTVTVGTYTGHESARYRCRTQKERCR